MSIINYHKRNTTFRIFRNHVTAMLPKNNGFDQGRGKRLSKLSLIIDELPIGGALGIGPGLGGATSKVHTDVFTAKDILDALIPQDNDYVWASP